MFYKYKIKILNKPTTSNRLLGETWFFWFEEEEEKFITLKNDARTKFARDSSHESNHGVEIGISRLAFFIKR
jgi:hypothetical protein